MSGKHAKVTCRDGAYVIEDAGSRNGTFIRLTGEVELKPGDVVLAGKQLLRFDPGPPPQFQLLQYSGEVGLTFGLRIPETIVGRGRGDLTFPDDVAMADAHFRVIKRDDRYFASDCGSRNGTYIKITSGHELRDGDIVIFGKHVLRFTIVPAERFEAGDTAPV